MPRWLAHLLVILGWLLTPVWAWAASHVGLWLGALVALRLQNPVVMLTIAGFGALVFGFAVLWTWIRFMRRLPHLDRKSTRLNSSHGYISYAVFCLKKKIDSVFSPPGLICNLSGRTICVLQLLGRDAL